MGRLVADTGKRDWEKLTAEYGAMLMEGLSVMGCRRSDRGQARQPLRVQHLQSAGAIPVMGILKYRPCSEKTPTYGRLELLDLIEDYRQGLVPLIVPLTLLKHHLNRHPVPDWVHQQVYLRPYPKERMLRSHV